MPSKPYAPTTLADKLAETQKKHERSLKENFEKMLKGQMHLVPTEHFPTKATFFDDMFIQRTGDPDSLKVTFSFQDAVGAHKTADFTVTAKDSAEGGWLDVDGEVPPEFTEKNLNKVSVIEEVFHAVKMMGFGAASEGEVDFIQKSKFELASVNFHPKLIPRVSNTDRPSKPRAAEDLADEEFDAERIPFFVSQPDFLFIMDNEGQEFFSHHVFVFPWGMVVEGVPQKKPVAEQVVGESPYYALATYYIPFEKNLINVPTRKGLTQEVVDGITNNKELEDLLKVGLDELYNTGRAVKRTHVPSSGKASWKERHIDELKIQMDKWLEKNPQHQGLKLKRPN